MSTDRPLRLGIWCAVSSAPQAAADRASLPDQEQAGRAPAAAIGATVVAVYTVPGHTRDYWNWYQAEQEMAAYRCLRADLEDHRLDLLWLLDPDRAGRDPALAQQMYSLATKCDCEMYTASAPHPIGMPTAGHRYLYAIQSVRSGEDQSLRIDHYKSGMRGRVERRGLIANTIPFWLDAIRDPSTGKITSYQLNANVATMDELTRLFLAGHNFTEIARRLNAGGFTAAKGGLWHFSTVRQVLQSDVPAGIATWHPTANATPSPLIPAIWDPDTFSAVIRERQRRIHSPRTRKESSPFSGVAICERCGRSMGRVHVHNRPSLRCANHAERAFYPSHACHPNIVPDEQVAAAVAAYLDTLTTPANLDQALAHLDPGPKTRLQVDLHRAQVGVADLEAQRQRLALALAAGKMDADIYRNADDRILAGLTAERSRVLELQSMIDRLPDLDHRRQILSQIASIFSGWIQIAAPATVAATLQEAGIRIHIENGRVLRVTLAA